ncbi:hypothetical protein MVEN_01004600 [Mycena venus]|uniref:F-box domain-containing protein n=1 Tax=Mycena venus TaxID=2733690 RepID=A0A8H6YCX7_9AGAR|nr:hypothetical protein MVEN_01004600 [Mycena venus]
MHHLPPELLFHILELSVSPYDLRRSCNPEHEYPHLRSTALVCRAWLAPSQMLLWRYVSLSKTSHVQRWIDSPAEYTTVGLTIGLKTLRLIFITVECLSLPVLRGQIPSRTGVDPTIIQSCTPDLTALIIRTCWIPVGQTCDFAFRLQSLQLMYSDIHPTVMENIIRKSVHTLQCLELDRRYRRDSRTLFGLYKHFHVVAANIQVLRIAEPYSSLVPFLASCVALRQLELGSKLDIESATAIFKVLPAPLEDLYLETDEDQPAEFSIVSFFLDTVSQGEYSSLSRLSRLHLKQYLINEMGVEESSSQAPRPQHIRACCAGKLLVACRRRVSYFHG